MAITLEPNDRAKLRELLEQEYDLEELRNLAFDLGVDYNRLSHSTTTQLSRELVSYFERRGNLSSLVTKMLSRRHDPFLVALSTKLSPGSPHTKVQIIVAQDVDYNVNEIIADLATKLKIDTDQVELIGAAWGSLHLLLGLPEEAASALINSQVQDLVNGKYRVISIKTFDSLDTASQEAWRNKVREGFDRSIPSSSELGFSNDGNLSEQSQPVLIDKHQIAHRSGGVDVDANNVTVGQDVVGRDKVIQLIENYYAASNVGTAETQGRNIAQKKGRSPILEVLLWLLWVLGATFFAALAVIVGGWLWNFINTQFKWTFYLGGSGNEPYGIAAFVWGAILAFAVSGAAFMAGVWYIPQKQRSFRRIFVTIALYTIFGGLGAMLFYGLGVRHWVESANLGYAGQELIIAVVWSLILSGLVCLSLLFLPRNVTVLDKRRVWLQIPLAVVLVVLAVFLSLNVALPATQIDQLRGFFAGVALRLGLFLGLLISIVQELRLRSILQSLRTDVLQPLMPQSHISSEPEQK